MKNAEGRRGTCVSEGRARGSFEKVRNRGKMDEAKGKSAENRMKLINEPDAKRGSNESRKGGSATPRKLYRNSEPVPVANEPISPTPDDSSPREACRVTTTKEETGQMTWKTERTEIREGGLTGRPETRLAEELPIPEETMEEIDSERSRTYPKYRRAVEKDKAADAEVGSGRTMTEGVVVTDFRDSPPISGPVLKLRLEKPGEDPKTPSGAKEQEVSSKNRQEPVSKPSYEVPKVHRPVEPKESLTSREKPFKTRKDSYERFPMEERKPIDEKSVKRSDEEKSDRPKDEEEEIIEELQGTAVSRSDYSATSRMKRTRSVTRKGEDP
ncbi:uncharacterized protein [Venturia canescens]|uniref:uncharacterized protein n=1 Tax=Venturia canescens TaxID=32260 RepID=UPI001C9CF12F|nr:uncharacterized protein LOC122414590 [Venturia canescens]